MKLLFLALMTSLFTANISIAQIIPFSFLGQLNLKPSSCSAGITPGDSLLIVKKTYTASVSTGTFDFNPTLGGGSVSFSGFDTYNHASNWGPQQLFDNATGIYDWCNYPGTNPLFGQFTFPRAVTLSKIFIIPRNAKDKFPANVTVKVDGVNFGTYPNFSIDSSHGSSISYSGAAICIDINATGTTVRLEFNSSVDAYIGEIEFWGH